MISSGGALPRPEQLEDLQGRYDATYYHSPLALALREGATENAEAAKDLLQHLVEHGVDPARRRLFRSADRACGPEDPRPPRPARIVSKMQASI
jgi:hypothetical protein